MLLAEFKVDPNPGLVLVFTAVTKENVRSRIDGFNFSIQHHLKLLKKYDKHVWPPCRRMLDDVDSTFLSL